MIFYRRLFCYFTPSSPIFVNVDASIQREHPINLTSSSLSVDHFLDYTWLNSKSARADKLIKFQTCGET